MNNSWIDPVIFSLGPLQVRWYGLMYVIGFIIGAQLIKVLAKQGYSKIAVEKIDSFITYLIVGMFLGARLTYVFVYNWEYYSQNLSEVFSVWQGGLSFHGALLGMILSMITFARMNKLNFFEVSDVLAVVGAPGLFFGRIGNFINGELWGRTTDVPWGIVFPDGGIYPRHPSQLYEAALEGVVLFCILWFGHKKFRYQGVASALFLTFYGVFRFIVEFFREPDAQLGFFFGGVTMGQMLCFIMIVAGGVMFTYALKQKRPIPSKV